MISQAARLTTGWLSPGAEPRSDTDCVEPSVAAPFSGRYRLLRMVGRGGFGEVWQAYDPVLQKHVAIKKPRLNQLPALPPRANFLDEARKAASLRHPAIVRIYDVGQEAEGYYIVSEFIEGESLQARMQAGRQPFEWSARLIATVAGALHAAHLAGLVHRDVKPANILLDQSGNPYLADFGLALREEEQLSERSNVCGTLAYMAPEQVRGDTHLMDGRADIYALGAVLYELLTGRPPFRGGDVDEYRELILRREPRPPRSIDDAVPVELERVCLKCLAKEVRDRYTTANDLASDLNAWLEKRAGPAGSGTERSVPGLALKAAAAAVLILSLVGGVIGVALLSGALDWRARPSSEAGERTSKAPTVKELLWPKDRAPCRWELLPDTNQLKVYTEATTLLQIGDTRADSWNFTATVRQLDKVGRIGLFLGYRKDSETATAAFELIQLVVVENRGYLQRSIETYPYAVPFVGVSGTVYASVPVNDLREENTIRLVVRDNRLSEVRFNGERLPALLDGTGRPAAAGPFGLFNRNSDSLVSNLLFQDEPIPLLADASVAKEKR
jgi:serine/threonine protein kinase